MEKDSVDIPIAITSLLSILDIRKDYPMKGGDGLPNIDQLSFINMHRTVRLCDECKTPFKEGALDFLSDEFVCPYCANGKDEE